MTMRRVTTEQAAISSEETSQDVIKIATLMHTLFCQGSGHCFGRSKGLAVRCNATVCAPYE